MDKETARELEKLKGKVETLEEAKRSWDKLVRDTVIQTMKWLIGIAATGIAFGWNVPENVRKSLVEWIGK